MDILASIIIVTYNHRRYMDACIRSLSNQEYPHEIIIIDNGSSDGTCEFIERNFPKIKLIRNNNTGYGAGNNLGVKHSKGKYVVILNPDTIMDKNWLHEIIGPLENNNQIITSPKILMYDGMSINTCGNTNHFSGLTFTRGLGENPNFYTKEHFLTGVSGACFAIKREDYLKIGGFDESFFLYNEDSEFSWRAHLLDFKILYVPTSIMKHDYKYGVLPEKIYFLEIGRYRILKKYLSGVDFITLSPSLLIVELLVFGYSLKCGYKGICYKLKALKEIFSIRYGRINKQKNRKILLHLSPTIPINQLTSNRFEKILLKVSNKIFKLNLKVLL